MTALGRIIPFLERLLGRLVSGTEVGTSLALMRIGIALSLWIELLQFALTDFGREVLVFGFADASQGGYRSIRPSFLLEALGGATPEALYALVWTDLLLSSCLLVGLFGRLVALACLVLTVSIIGPSSPVSGGDDQLLAAGLFTLTVSDCTSTLSLDCFLREGKWSSQREIPSWPRRLGLWQLAIVYGTTGLQKLVSTAWLPFDGFSALYQILQSPNWARLPELVERTNGALVVPLALATALTIIWECTFPIVLWQRRLRLAYALVGIGLHVGIWLTLEVGQFGLLALSFYPCLFAGGALPRVWESPAGLHAGRALGSLVSMCTAWRKVDVSSEPWKE